MKQKLALIALCVFISVSVTEAANSIASVEQVQAGSAEEAPAMRLITRSCAGTGDAVLFAVTGAAQPQVFAPTFPSRPGCVEKHLAVSSGEGGFSKNHVFVTQGRDIYEITPDGSAVSHFARIPSNVTSHTGITFDREGTFSHNMIVTAVNGDMFRINAAGAVAFLANVGMNHEDPEVVPTGFGPLGGQVWTASKFIGRVYSVSPDGEVSIVTSEIPGAETIHVVPGTKAAFARLKETLLSDHAQFRSAHVPGDVFTIVKGKVLVGSEERSDMMLISASSKGYSLSTFDAAVQQPEALTLAR